MAYWLMVAAVVGGIVGAVLGRAMTRAIRARIFWISAGFICAGIVAFVLAPRSDDPGLMYFIAGLILLGGIARSNKS